MAICRKERNYAKEKETSIDTNDLETGSENESVEVMSDEACLEETNDLGNAENPASDENIISVESENLNEEIAEDQESEADLLVEESDSVPTESIWVGENLQVDHKIVNYWNEGYQGEIIITNLWETLTYTVTESKIIEPNETDTILIQEGRDMLTLLTCHPYASGGRQRLLVFCDRAKGEVNGTN